MTDFSQRLLTWFDNHGRKNLPWQTPGTPYQIWVSEIMLQQTQVETVIPYFHRFMQQFPSIQSLANANIDEVLHLWTGLGYYARARNLHKCALMLEDEYNSELPQSCELLNQLPGIGRSTAGAIASAAFGQQEAILDGNVKRVLARHFAVSGWPGNKKVEDQLWKHAENLVPSTRNRDYTQASMDLGAMVCTRSKPKCHECPLADTCQAYALEKTHEFPGKKPKKTLPHKQVHMLLLEKQGELLLQQRPPAGIWGGLWSLPEFDTRELLQEHLQNQQLSHHTQQQWPSITHTFSHFKLDIHPVHISASEITNPPAIKDSAPTCWYNLSQPQKLGLAAPVQKLIDRLTRADLFNQP